MLEQQIGESREPRSQKIYDAVKNLLSAKGEYIFASSNNDFQRPWIVTFLEVYHYSQSTVILKNAHYKGIGGSPDTQHFSFCIFSDSQKREEKVLSKLESRVEGLQTPSLR